MKRGNQKCKHSGCQCEAREGSQYCSSYCEMNEGEHTTDECNCGHSACVGVRTETADPAGKEALE